MKQYEPIVHLYTVIMDYRNESTGTHIRSPYYFHLSKEDAALWINQVIEAKRQRYELIEQSFEGFDRAVYNKSMGILWKYKIEEIFDYNIRIK